MKKTMKCIVAVFVMALAFVMMGTTAQASEVKRVNDSLVLDLNESSVISNVGDYTGGPITDLQQTGATIDSITIGWSATAGAVSYEIYNYSTGEFINRVTETTYTISNIPKDFIGSIAVLPVDAQNQQVGKGMAIYVSTQPTKVEAIDYYKTPFSGSNKLTIAWTPSPVAEAYEVVLYNKSGKVKQKTTIKYDQYVTQENKAFYTTKFSKSNTQNIYKVVITPYITIKGGTEKVNGEKATFYAVPQPKITSKDSDININSFNLKWKKVNGATGYEIYVSTKEKTGYKKVATVKKNNNKYVLKKYKGKTINTLKNKYHIKVVTVAKFGKKKVKSKNYSYTRIWSYYK